MSAPFTDPLVSVVMPARNAGPWLAPAVASILGQTWHALELILVDDHSNDGAIAGLDRSDRRLRIVPNPGRGLVAALNAGIDVARGEFIARMDADDIALPTRIARQLEYLQAHPQVAIAGAQVEIFAEGPLHEGFRRYQDWLNGLCRPQDIARELFIESPIPHPTAMFRRAAIAELRGYRDVPWAEDYDLWLRADAAGLAMGKPHGVLLRWREHRGRLTHTDHRYAVARFLAAKAHYLAHHRLPARDLVIWGTGRTGVQLHDLLLGHGRSVAGFVDVRPRRIGGYKRGRPVVGPEDLARFDGNFVLVAVGSRGARETIRPFLADKRVEGSDYLFAA